MHTAPPQWSDWGAWGHFGGSGGTFSTGWDTKKSALENVDDYLSGGVTSDAQRGTWQEALHQQGMQALEAIVLGRMGDREAVGVGKLGAGELESATAEAENGARASSLSSDLAQLAEQHVANSGTTVLGRYPGYISKGTAKGASYFDIGDKWDAVVARGQDPWALNQHFLDGRIAAGDKILLSVPKSEIPPGTYLAREIKYLTDNGYQWVNQWSLRPGG